MSSIRLSGINIINIRNALPMIVLNQNQQVIIILTDFCRSEFNRHLQKILNLSQ